MSTFAGANQFSTHVRRYKPTPHINAHDVFKQILNEHSEFTNLLGFSFKKLIMGETLSTGVDYRLIKGTERKHPSKFWRFNDEKTGGGAIIQLDFHPNKPTILHWRCCWVPQEFENQGIAGRVITKLQQIADQTEVYIKEKTYQNEQIIGNHLILMLVPNPFYVEKWSLDQKENNIDWSDPEGPSFNDMLDETIKPLPDELRRLDWQTLRDFYSRFGFVEIPEMGHEKTYSEFFHKIVDDATMARRSYKIGREIMIWPERHAHYHK